MRVALRPRAGLLGLVRPVLRPSIVRCASTDLSATLRRREEPRAEESRRGLAAASAVVPAAGDRDTALEVRARGLGTFFPLREAWGQMPGRGGGLHFAGAHDAAKLSSQPPMCPSADGLPVPVVVPEHAGGQVAAHDPLRHHGQHTVRVRGGHPRLHLEGARRPQRVLRRDLSFPRCALFGGLARGRTCCRLKMNPGRAPVLNGPLRSAAVHVDRGG